MCLRCFLSAYCWLLLVNVSACLNITQLPRYINVRRGQRVCIFCYVPNVTDTSMIAWSKDNETLSSGGQIDIDKSLHYTSYLEIRNVDIDNKGIYACSFNKNIGPGTQLDVFRYINFESAEKKSYMKDVMIIIQLTLLIICFVVPAWHYLKTNRKEDAIYEEPGDDHLYEGLDAENCGLYEDIPAYNPVSEAPWEEPECPEEF